MGGEGEAVKRARLVVVLGAIVAAAFVSVHGAGANNGATTIEFVTPTYSFHIFGVNGVFSCSGTRIIKTAPKPFVKDSETCLVTGAFTPGTYPVLPEWFGSDYEYWISPGGGFVRPPIKGNIEIVSNGDGTTTWHITAYYTP
jgi:hypothetical protein